MERSEIREAVPEDTVIPDYAAPATEGNREGNHSAAWLTYRAAPALYHFANS